MTGIVPSKRSSIENLKKASRVKNSNIFAKEQQHLYDPAKPTILDGRPLSLQLHGNANSGRASDGFQNNTILSSPLTSIYAENKRSSETPQEARNSPAPLSPSKSNASPTKSSLSKKTGANFRYSSFDPENGIWEDGDDQEKKAREAGSAYTYAKSVTFDQAPPQINEYEMTTPVPSSIASGSREGSYESLDDEEDDMSFERGSSMDHDDSFDASLEDTDKTPVVLPEDWRFMSPDTANRDLAQHEEDVFDDDLGSPEPTAYPGRTLNRPHQTSVNSVDSDGQARPLPPLPPMGVISSGGGRSRDSLSGTIERMSSSQRALPSPPQAPTISKSDIRRMSTSSLSIEDRLRLMMINKEQDQQSEAELQRERRMRRAESKESSPARSEACNDAHEDSMLSIGTSPADDLAPRLDRISILKQLRSAQGDSDQEDTEHTPQPLIYDPDIPIPSLEDPTQSHHEIDEDDEVVIKEEENEDDNGLYSIPDMYCHSTDSRSEADDDEGSQYSQASAPVSIVQSEQETETPRAQSPAHESGSTDIAPTRVSLPDFMDFGSESSFNLGLNSYMTPPTETADLDKPLPPPPAMAVELPDLQAIRQSIQRPFTPEEQLEPPKLSFSEDDSSADPGTPNSVIRHPIARSPEPEIINEEDTSEELSTDSSCDQSKPVSADLDLQAEPLEAAAAPDSFLQVNPTEKRVSSLVQLEIPHDSLQLGLGLDLEQDFDRVVETQKVAFERSLQHLYHPFNGRFPSGELSYPKQSHMVNPLENIPYLSKPGGVRAPGHAESVPLMCAPLNIGHIANRTPGRQRGYLMRQNTKVVVASERALPEELNLPPPTESETSNTAAPEPNEVYNSTRKASQPTWTAEPWNNKSRRRSIRVGGEKATAKRKPVDGPVPPLPGLPSNVQDNLGAVTEEELAEEEAEEFEEGAERGRLFVKVIGVKDLQLPFPQSKSAICPFDNLSDHTANERTQFALTLDNGLHCVTTAWLELAREAPIGQEFELVVLNDLEFQLTLQMKLEEPKITRPASPSKPPPSPKKQGAFGRLFGSPKKKKESDHRFSQSQEVRRPITPPSAYELVQGLVAKDGSFARAYVSLSDHEKKTYGRPYHVDIKCFNEWALEEVDVGSSRSKKSVTQMQRRPPYEIGKLELQLMYVPKPKGAKDEDMPKSMNGAIRALREAEEKMKQRAAIKEFEGHLSQQGGDCPVSKIPVINSTN